MSGVLASYPAHREVDVALRDGGSIRLRPVRPDDEPGMRAFLEDLSVESRVFRFFSAASNLGLAARSAADVDYIDRYGIVAVAGDGTILAHGTYIRSGEDVAEVAFAVADALHGEGIATTMLAHLAEAARANGIPRFVAHVLPLNHRMLDVFRESGLEPRIQATPDALVLTMPTELGEGAQARYDERDAIAAAAAVGHVLRPRSVAIVGASERPGSVGGAILANVLAGGFTGAVHVVNARAATVHGLAAASTVREVDGDVELAVIATPAASVLQVARDCAAKGVRALVVISAGFGESGEDGRARQRELVAICRAAGMRLVGPNCLGVLATDPDVRLDATFAPGEPPAGNVAFLSQSGALGIAVMDAVRDQGFGLSAFVSVGDKADLSGNDFLAFWERDERTDVVLLYLESFGNARKFSRVARRVGRRKPIVAVKGGRTAAGARAAGSHTGALLAASDATVDALFSQAGVVRTDTLGELFDVATLLASQPAPAGPRVGIVTNGGGLGIMCADACEAAGLEVVATPPAVQADLRDRVSSAAALGNPMDLLAEATPEHFAAAIETLGRSGAVDALIVLYVPPLVTDPEGVAGAIRAAAERAGVPLAAVFAMRERPAAAAGLPCYRFPEEAVRALARAARYGAWRAEPAGEAAHVEADVGTAAAILAKALARGGGWLEPGETLALLDCYGIPQPRRELVADAAAAGAVARRWAVPVALKAVAPGLVHRSDAGAVVIGLRGPKTVARAAEDMAERLAAQGIEPTGFLVQEMAAPGPEVLAGVATDPTFGAVVAVAAGGTAVELLGDSAVRLTPLTRHDARAMVRELRTFPLLDGFRGAPPADVAALEDVLVRLGALADAHHEVAELECNPLVVGRDGVLAVDARVRVEAPAPSAPEPSLRAF